MNEVLMSHDGLDGRVIKVPETAVPIHMASGWKVVEGEQAEAKAAEKLAEDEKAALAPSLEESSEDTSSGSKSTRRSAPKE
jgi:hypothetical protein